MKSRRNPKTLLALLALAAMVAAAAGYLVTRADGSAGVSAAGTSAGASAAGTPSGTAATSGTASAAAAASTSVGQPLEGLEPAPGTAVATEEELPADAHASPVLTYLDWSADTRSAEAAGYVSGVVEDGGSCTLVLSRDGVSVTAELSGTADASTTVCGGFQVPAAELSPGTWTGVLQYSSATAGGTSAALSLEVPTS